MTGAIMTVKDLATYLRASETTIYRMVRRGELPGFQLGGFSWRFKRESIDAWMKAKEQRRK